MNCISNKKPTSDIKYPFTNQSDGFHKIGLVGYQLDAHITAFDISTYIECDTLIIASPYIDKLPNDYTYSRVKKVIFVKSRELSDIKPIIDVEYSVGNNVATIYEVTDDTDINLPGNVIYIYDSYIPSSICSHNIIMSKLCSNKIRKKIHKYCWLSEIKLLGFDTWSMQLSNINDNNVMILNSNGVYECNFTRGLVGSLVEFDKYDFKVIPVIDTFDKIDNPNKSIVFCGTRESGIICTLLTYIKQSGTRYDKCMFTCTCSDELKKCVVNTGCTLLIKPDIDEIVNFVKADGNKLLIFDDDCAQDKHLLKLYSTMVCNRDLFNLTVVMMCQYASSKIIKLNHDHFVLSNPSNMSDYKRLYNIICNYYPSCDVFKRDLEIMGKDYCAMVVNNIDKKNYKDKTFSVNADHYTLLDDLNVKFTPHTLINDELSSTYVKNTEDLNRVAETPETIEYNNELSDIELVDYPQTLILGNRSRCFKVFNAYTILLNSKNNSHCGEVPYLAECHIFVSPETDNKLIEEFNTANYCVHYGYNADEFCTVMEKHEQIHICIITSVLSECTRSFLKNKNVQEALHNGKHYKKCVTIIDPTVKSITDPCVINNFDYVITSYISDLKINNAYFQNISIKKFADMLDSIYCEDENELKVLVSHNSGDVKVNIFGINDTDICKFKYSPTCDRKITNRYDACFANLPKRIESNHDSE